MKYIITGGGTGGHLYPGIQIAKELKKRGHEVLFVASKNGIDQEIFNKENDLNFEVRYMDLKGFSRNFSAKNIYKNVVNVTKVLRRQHEAKKIMKKIQPDFVIGIGGYISYPIVSAAVQSNIKTAIHEQNSFPGLTNRQLAKKVDYVFNTYDKALDYFEPKKAARVINTSNPRIDEAKKYRGTDVTDIKENDLFQILVTGGSLGSEKINELALEYAKNNPNKQVTLVSGERYYEEVSKNSLPNLQVFPYLLNQLKYMEMADLVITRAGATTLLEVVVLEKLILAIPSPNVVADHQTANAMHFKNQNMLEVLAENEANNETLTTMIEKLIDNQDHYKAELKNGTKTSSLEKIINIIEE